MASLKKRAVGFALAGAAIAMMAGVAGAGVTLVRDSADFDWQYEMNVSPELADLDPGIHPEWVKSGTGSSVSGGILTVDTMPSGNVSFATNNTVGGIWPGKYTLATGFTVEARVKVLNDVAGKGLGVFAGPAGTTANAYLNVGTGGQGWNHATNLGLNANNDDFHVFRIAQEPGAARYSVWRDGVLLNDTLASAYNYTRDGIWFGDGSGSYAGEVQMDYVRFTPGAYAPAPSGAVVARIPFADVESERLDGKAPTTVKLDEYVPNTNAPGSNGSHNGTIAAPFESPFHGLLRPGDSSNFHQRHQYEFSVASETPNLSDNDGNGVADFTQWNTTGAASVSGGLLLVSTSQLSGGNSFNSTSAGQIWPEAGTHLYTGYTIEVRAKVLSEVAGGFGAFVVGANTEGTSRHAWLNVGANGQSWDARSPFAVGGPADNTDDFHVFRIAQQPYSGSGGTVYSVWRDGVLLSDSLGSGLTYTIAPRMFFADASSNIGGSVEYDYLRFFPGYCPPVDVPPVAILVESSTGEVVFRDDTSQQITSDIWGSQNGETLSFAFIDPLTGVRGTVSRVGFRLGSAAPGNVTAEFYDLEGDLLALLHPDVGVMPEGLAADAYNSVVGFQSLLDGVETSLIHKVVFTGAGDDAWVIGSFSGSDSTTLNDIAFNGFRIPEPATTALLGLGLAGLLARSRRRRRSA